MRALPVAHRATAALWVVQARAGREPPRSARDNVRLCCRSLDACVLLALVALLVYAIQLDYGVDLYSSIRALFSRELDVLQRIFGDVE
jgi:hypothetical protein